MELELDRFSGSELTSILLAEMRRRAADVSERRVYRRFFEDRFTRTSPMDPAAMRNVQDMLARHFPPGTEELRLSPLVPFGAHAAVAGVDQNRLVSTIRGTEVAADPTVVLAIEASERRSRLITGSPKNADVVNVAAFQRVTRAQTFEGALSFAHFELSGLVTAGRDSGSEEFERLGLDLHIGHITNGLRALGCTSVQVRISDFTGGRLERVIADLAERRQDDAVTIVPFPERTRARAYYTDFAIEVHAAVGDEWLEVGDGGAVDWSQRLVGSRKERMMISGLSVERLALVLG